MGVALFRGGAANNPSAPTDTIINIAVDYYERHNGGLNFNRFAGLSR